MSEGEKKYSKEWSKISESRVIEPFRTASEALDECEFRYNPAHQFNPGDVPYLEKTPLELEDFTPEFLFKINKDEIENTSGRKADELELHIVTKDPSLHLRKKLISWSISALPPQYSVPASELEELSGANGLFFGVIISPKRGIKHDEDLANSPGHIIAQKHFHLGPEPMSGSGFPHEYQDPANFPSGIDKKAFWYIDWLGTEHISDPEVEAKDILKIMFNRTCSDKIVNIDKGNSAGQILWLEIVTGIWLEISIVVLTTKDLEAPNKDDNGLYPQVIRTLTKATNMSFQSLRELFADDFDPWAISQLRSSLHAFLNVSEKIQKLKFTK